MSFKNFVCRFLLFVPFQLFAQEIEFCGLTISIGDSQEIVEKALQKQCNTQRPSNLEAVIYWERAEKEQPVNGMIFFRDSKVTSASRSIPISKTADPITVLDAILKAINKDNGNAESQAKLITSVFNTTEVNMTILRILLRGREVSVLVQTGVYPQFSVSESIVQTD